MSSNIVGYNKIQLSSGYNLIGTQFVQIGQQAKDIQQLAESTTLPGLDDESAFQTTLRLWNGRGYDTFGWLDADDGTANEVPAWNSKWLLYDMSDLATEEMPVGQGCWIVTSEDSEIVIAGEVPAEATKEVQLASGYNLLCNPFPEQISIQQVQSTDLPGLDEESAFQTTLRLWNGRGYDTFGWLDADDGTANEVPAWNSKCLLYDMSDLAATNIKVGEGFWIVTTAASSVTFTK